MNTRRRPSRSAIRPPSSRKPPKVSTYAFTTQARFAWEKLSPLPIEGRATLTIDASRTTMNCAKQRRARAIQRRRSYSWAVVICAVLLWSGEDVAYNRKRNSGSFPTIRNHNSVCVQVVTYRRPRREDTYDRHRRAEDTLRRRARGRGEAARRRAP